MPAQANQYGDAHLLADDEKSFALGANRQRATPRHSNSLPPQHSSPPHPAPHEKPHASIALERAGRPFCWSERVGTAASAEAAVGAVGGWWWWVCMAVILSACHRVCVSVRIPPSLRRLCLNDDWHLEVYVRRTSCLHDLFYDFDDFIGFVFRDLKDQLIVNSHQHLGA